MSDLTWRAASDLLTPARIIFFYFAPGQKTFGDLISSDARFVGHFRVFLPLAAVDPFRPREDSFYYGALGVTGRANVSR
jgi:hypothetical protein